MKNRHGKCPAGFTLIELMIGVAVLAILLSVAVPSFQNLIERRRVTAAAESILSALQLARSEAIKQNSTVEVNFDTEDSGAWCYGLDDDLSTECDCDEKPWNCTVAGESRVVANDGSNAPFPGVVIGTTGFGDDVEFSPPRGTADNGSVTVNGAGGGSITVAISNMGRVRACSDDGFVGYDPCSP